MTQEMQTLHVRNDRQIGDIQTATRVANGIATEALGPEAMCLSWYDSARDVESPRHTNLCGCGLLPGYAEYAINRGASLKVLLDDGRYTFYYRGN